MDVLVYASLLKKIRGVASGIADIEYNHDTSTLDFICVDGTIIKVPLDNTALTQEQIIATVSCGAVTAGDVIPVNTDITTLTKRLLVKDLAPSITITSTESNTIVYEKGVPISPTFTVEVNKIQSFDADINNVTFSSNPTDANFNMVDNTPNAITNTYTKTTTIIIFREYARGKSCGSAAERKQHHVQNQIGLLSGKALSEQPYRGLPSLYLYPHDEEPAALLPAPAYLGGL